MSVKRKKNKQLLANLEHVANFANSKAEAGWIVPNQRHDKTKLNMAELAYVLMNGATITHKGTGTVTKIPPRPIFKVTVDQKAKEWVQEAEQLGRDILEGKRSEKDANELLGALIADDMKGVINKSGNWTPNAPSTVRRKGKNTPLIDTGELREAISYKVDVKHTGRIKR